MAAPARGGRSGESRTVLADVRKHTSARRSHPPRKKHRSAPAARRPRALRCIGCLRAEKAPQWFAIRLRAEHQVLAVPAEQQMLWRDAAPLCTRCHFDLKFDSWEWHVSKMFGTYAELRMPRGASR